MNINEMEYKSKTERKLLYRNIYKNHEYFILSLGTHPCAYVKLVNPNLKHIVNHLESPHGGITFNDIKLNIGDEIINGNIIGWDYAHAGDYMGYYMEFEDIDLDGRNRKYSTIEIIKDCENVIDELTVFLEINNESTEKIILDYIKENNLCLFTKDTILSWAEQGEKMLNNLQKKEIEFRVIDNKTGREVGDKAIREICKDTNLIEMDIDQFAITEDGHLILLDDCGNSTYVDMNRFTVEIR